MWIENNTDKKECFRMDMVAVLIPCYNEAKTIEKVVKDYLKVLPENSKIYVYDNNSFVYAYHICRHTYAYFFMCG